MRLLGGGTPPNDYTEIVVVDGASTVGFKMTIHTQGVLNVGTYPLKQSNFQKGIDSVPFNNIFFKIWDSSIKNYAYYGSVEDQGNINLKRDDNGIISGSFSGKFVRDGNPNEFIQITDGRFDINSFTLENQPFP